jgi:hypothetical protein
MVANILQRYNLKTANAMKPAMRQKLAREPFEEKIRKVGQLIRLAKTFPRRSSQTTPSSLANTTKHPKNPLPNE